MTAQSMSSLWRSIIPLLAVGLIGAVIATISHEYASDRTEEYLRNRLLRELLSVMPLEHDNDVLNDSIEILVAECPGEAGPLPVFRVRSGERPVGVILLPTATEGYKGAIQLIMGIDYEGTITAVRVREQHETVDLGDAVDQGVSDWIHGFSSRSIANPPAPKWKVKRDGGDFDQLSGATISPRAVVSAVYHCLLYYEENRESLFASP
jgi:electron transport complex protein RnfG